MSANLTTCPTCGREISFNATACPQCGEPGPRAAAHRVARETAVTKIVLVILLVVGAVAFLGFSVWKTSADKADADRISHEMDSRH